VEGFDISGLFQTGIKAGASVPPGTRITGNTIHDLQSSFSSPAIGITPGPRNEVDHNTVDGGQYGIFLSGSSAAGPDWQTHIHHNQVNGAQFIGIMLWQAPGCQLDHNTSNNDALFGIYLASSPNCTADHNQADNNGVMGILLDSGGSPNCAVTDNEANNNGSYGIGVATSCGTRFERNVAEGNGQYDLAVLWGSDPTCNTYLKNHADTAFPSLALWDVK
jgi:parallel beta-helix repeat protein